MKNYFYLYYSFIAMAFIINACAIVITPTGGPQDKLPPKVSREHPLNYSKKFKSSKIEINFDEYIRLNNVNQELVVSPPVKTTPKVTVKGKKLTVVFEEKLKDSTTYSLRFGRSIMDIHEDNVLEDYQFVFSTGDNIDSLSVSGIVTDAYRSVPVGKIKILMYPEGCDTCFKKSQSEYYTKSLTDGSFTLTNIKTGAFDIYALKDENNNNKYDKGEEMSFLDSSVSLIQSIKDIKFCLS
jgi:hypothetical protein